MKGLGLTALLLLLLSLLIFMFVGRPAMRANQLKQSPGLKLELKRTVSDWVSDSAAEPLEKLVRITSGDLWGSGSMSRRGEPLPSLRNLSHLEEVELGADILQQVDLRGCNALRKASVSLRGERSSIVLSGLPALEYAGVKCSGTTPIDLRDCPKLRSVYARSPVLLGGSSAVKSLTLAESARLPAEDWAQLDGVETLNLNGIKAFPPLANPAGLRELNLRNFPAELVPWTSLVGLEKIWLYDANSDVDLRSLSSLNWLYLGRSGPDTRLRLPASLPDLRVNHHSEDVLDLTRLIEFDGSFSGLSFLLPGRAPVVNLPSDLIDGLDQLSLGCFDSCSDAAWEQLARAPKLRQISAAGHPSPVALKSLSTMPTLENLSIQWDMRVLAAGGGKEPIVLDGEFSVLREVQVATGMTVSLLNVPSHPKITRTPGPSQRMMDPEKAPAGSRIYVTPPHP